MEVWPPFLEKASNGSPAGNGHLPDGNRTPRLCLSYLDPSIITPGSVFRISRFGRRYAGPQTEEGV